MLRLAIVLFAAFLSTLNAGTGIDAELLKKSKQSMDKGVKFLLSKQAENGAWGPYGGLPPITAIAATSLATGPNANEKGVKAAIAKAETYLLKFANQDGSIWRVSERGFPNYTTAVSMVALYVINKEKHAGIIRKARTFLKKGQFNANTGASPIEEGGIGYGGDKTKSDLSNTQLALEALYITSDLENESAPTEAAATKKCWENAQKFITRCQALPKVNDMKWAQKVNGDDLGGSIYSPDRSHKDKNGNIKQHPVYGSMTYVGLKTMIYAGQMLDDQLIKDDPRVKAAFGWAQRHYTLDENPGVGKEGHFYYIQTFTKALDAYGEDQIKDSKGKLHYWRKDVVNKLMALQKDDGSWVNANGRWMENMPEMVTSFSLLSMNIALKKDLK